MTGRWQASGFLRRSPALSAPPRPPAAPGSLATALSVGALCLIWGTTWLAIAYAKDDVPPLTGAAWRFSISAAVFLLISPRLARAEGGTRPPLSCVLSMGVLQVAVVYGVIYWAETKIPSGLTAILFSVYPLLLAGLSRLMLPEEPLHGRNWLGFALGLAGIALLFSTSFADLGTEVIWMGVVALLAPLGAAYSNLVLKVRGVGVSSVLTNRDGLFVGSILLWIAAFALERGEHVVWSGRAIVSVAYLSLAGTVAAFSLYFWLLRYKRATHLSLIAYVTPPLAVFVGWLLNDEEVDAATLPAAAIVLTGVALARWQPRRSTAGS